MKQIIENFQIDGIENVNKQAEFIGTLFLKSKALIENEEGFKLSFYEPPAAMVNEFPEKEFYPLKLEKIRNAIKDLKIELLAGDLSNKMTTVENLTNNFLEKEFISQADLEIYKIKATECHVDLGIIEKVNKIKMYQEDLLKHLPKIEKDVIVETWFIKQNEKPECIFKGREQINRKMNNYLLLPIPSETLTKIIYTGFSPFPRIGHGTKEIWEKKQNVWKLKNSIQTWIK